MKDKKQMSAFSSFHEFALAAGIPEHREMAWHPYRDELLNRDYADLDYLLDRDYQLEILKAVELPDEDVIREKLLLVLDQADRDPAARLFLQAVFWLYFCTVPEDSRIVIHAHATGLSAGFAGSEKLFGENAAVANLIILFGAARKIRRKHRELGIPEKITKDTIHTLRSSVIVNYRSCHISGILLTQMPWSRLYAEGLLFRIGRLNFLMETCLDWAPVIYRKCDSDELRVLCRPGSEYPSARTGKKEKTRLVFDHGTVTGTLIPPSGNVIPEREVTLDLNKWRDVISPWDITPSVHIPSDHDPLNPELVKDSFRQAMVFFRTYFRVEPKFFFCGSWLLDPHLQQYIPDSNIDRFRRLGYCQFIPYHPRAGFLHIFGRTDGELSSYPADTRLQKALLALAVQPPENSGTGRMFIEGDKIDRIGTDYYLKRYAFLEAPC